MPCHRRWQRPGGHSAPEQRPAWAYLRPPTRSRETPCATLLLVANNKSAPENEMTWQRGGGFSRLTWLYQPLPAAESAPGSLPGNGSGSHERFHCLLQAYVAQEHDHADPAARGQQDAQESKPERQSIPATSRSVAGHVAKPGAQARKENRWFLPHFHTLGSVGFGSLCGRVS